MDFNPTVSPIQIGVKNRGSVTFHSGVAVVAASDELDGDHKGPIYKQSRTVRAVRDIYTGTPA